MHDVTFVLFKQSNTTKTKLKKLYIVLQRDASNALGLLLMYLHIHVCKAKLHFRLIVTSLCLDIY